MLFLCAPSISQKAMGSKERPYCIKLRETDVGFQASDGEMTISTIEISQRFETTEKENEFAIDVYCGTHWRFESR